MSKTAVFMMLLMLTGCSSFRTTIWQRCSDHRLYPNQPCAKTKGLPVKLKVPSHVEVTISESFFIQATKPKAITPRSEALDNAERRLQDATIAALEAARVSNELHRKKLEHPNNANVTAAASAAQGFAKTANDNLEQAKKLVENVKGSEPEATPTAAQCREIEVCLDGQPVRHFDVDTKVIYTDKVFTVDFRRPAGGVLDLSAINMDDEQYFRQIKAAYEEQTLEQINGAIADITAGVTGQSVSGMSATINGARVQGLATDTRTVAVTRFDISDPSWEHHLNCFVDRHVTSQYTHCSYQN